ncbi:MAG: hypothetical protein ACTSXX_05265 [Candidatus Baldrarchaeia archaeon]
MQRYNCDTIFILITKRMALEGDIKLALLELEGLGLHNIIELPENGFANEHYLANGIRKELLSLLSELVKINGTNDSTINHNNSKLKPVKILKAVGNFNIIYPLATRSGFIREIIAVPLRELDPLGEREIYKRLGDCGIITVKEKPILHIRIIPISVFLEISEGIASICNDFKEIDHLVNETIDAVKMCNNDVRKHHSSKVTRILSRSKFNNYASHAFHLYKARFFPRLFRAVANYCLGLKGQKLLDPFVGSGTSLLESYFMGIEAVGIDIDPLCAFMSKVKLQVLEWNVNTLRKAIEIFQHMKKKLQSYHSKVDSNQVSILLFTTNTNIRSYSSSLSKTNSLVHHQSILPSYITKKLDPKQVTEIESECLHILSLIDELDSPLSEFFKLMLSDAIVRKIKLRFHGLGTGRFAIELSKKSIIELFLEGTKRSLKSLYAYMLIVSRLGLKSFFTQLSGLNIINSDFLSTDLDPESFDAIVTSPPYLPAASGRESYIRSKGPSLMALRLINDERDIWKIEERFIGAMSRDGEYKHIRPTEIYDVNIPDEAKKLVKFLSTDKYRWFKAYPTLAYFKAMRNALAKFYELLKPNGRVGLIISTYVTFYRYRTREILAKVDVAGIMEELARNVGFKVIKRIDVILAKENVLARPRALDPYSESVIIMEK